MPLPTTTESDPHYEELYNDAREYQAPWSWFKTADTADVFFLAGMIFDGHKDLSEEKRTKLQGNAHRAVLELNRRWQASQTRLMVICSLGAAVIGAGAALIGAQIGSG